MLGATYKNITDKIFWYKAKDVPNFKLGCHKFIKYHKESYDKEWNKRLPIFNPADAKKKNYLRLVIEKIK